MLGRDAAGADLLREGNLEGAAERARQVIAEDPRGPGARCVLAQVAFQRGRPEEALDFALQELEMDPDAVHALMTAAKSYKRLKCFKEAASMWLRVAKAQARSARGFVEAGRCELALRNHKRALALSERAIQREPTDATALALRVEALIRLGRASELVTATKALASVEPEAALAALPCLIEVPGAPGVTTVVSTAVTASSSLRDTAAGRHASRLLLSAAGAALRKGDETAASQMARAALILNHEDRRATRIVAKITKPLLLRARQAAADGALDAAQALYSRLGDIDPSLRGAAIEAASLAERRGNWVEASRILNGLVRSDDPRMTARAARAAEMAGDPESALLAWRRVVVTCPDHPKAAACVASLVRRLSKVIRTKQKAGQLETAVRISKLVMQADPANKVGHDVIKRALSAEASVLRNAVRDNDLVAQEAAANRMLALDPSRPDALRALSQIYWSSGRRPLAADVLSRLVQVQPQNPTHWVRLARCLKTMKRRDEASEAAHRALTIDPNNAAARKIVEATSPPAVAA